MKPGYQTGRQRAKLVRDKQGGLIREEDKALNTHACAP